MIADFAHKFTQLKYSDFSTAKCGYFAKNAERMHSNCRIKAYYSLTLINHYLIQWNPVIQSNTLRINIVMSQQFRAAQRVSPSR